MCSEHLGLIASIEMEKIKRYANHWPGRTSEQHVQLLRGLLEPKVGVPALETVQNAPARDEGLAAVAVLGLFITRVLVRLDHVVQRPLDVSVLERLPARGTGA